MFQIIDGESSMNVTEAHLPQLVQYLSQVYNAFSGEIPKPTEFKQVDTYLHTYLYTKFY